MSKYKTMELPDLLEARGKAIERQTEIKNGSEGRSLTASEVQELEGLRSDIALINLEIDERNRANNGKPTPQSTRSELSLTKILRSIASGNPEAEEGLLEVFADGVRAMTEAGVMTSTGFNINFDSRSLLTAKGKSGTNIIETERKGFLAPLERDLILAKLGANIATGLKGNVEFVKGGGTTASWKGENAKVEATGATFTTVKFSPKRLTAKVEISNLLLLQDSLGTEAYIRNQILLAIRKKLESTFLGTGAGSADEPTGLLNGSISDKGAATYDRIIDMIFKLDRSGALVDTAKFATTPIGHSILCKTPVADKQSLGFLADVRDKSLIGYGLETSSSAAKVNAEEPVLFANWADLFIGQWGGMNIVADSVTRADEAVTRFIINTYWDGGFTRDESVVKATISMAKPGVGV